MTETNSNNSNSNEMILKIGLFADIQYGNIPTYQERKFFRNGIEQTKRIVNEFNKHQLDFVVNLGDIIEGNCKVETAERDLQLVQDELCKLKQNDLEIVHVIGNHCLQLPRSYLQEKFNLKHTHFSFVKKNWRFIVLDTLDISLKGTEENSKKRKQANELLETLKGEHILPYNGTISTEQLNWLKEELQTATKLSQTCMIFTHIPFNPNATSTRHLVWDYQKILDVLDTFDNIAAVICGHYHRGGYDLRHGVHHLTMKGVLEAPVEQECFGVMRVYEERLELDGYGVVQSQTFELKQRNKQ